MTKSAAAFALLGPVVLLAVTSLLIIRSVAPAAAIPQLLFFAISLVIIFIMGRIDYQLYVFSPWPWYLVSLALLTTTLVFGSVIRGASRWLDVFGLSFQSSEAVKPLLIVFVAAYLAHHLPQSIRALVIFLLLMFVPTLLIFLQPDLGSAILIMLISAAAIIASGVGFKRVLITSLAVAIMLPIGYSQLKSYQRQRLESFVNPSVDPLGTGYNALQATIAVGSGKFIGRGLGQGTQSHLRFLPERHTDFIFASLVEELGFVGGVIVIVSYLWLSLSLMRFARYASSDVGSIICLTTSSLLLVQAFINIGMNMGLLPITGITLPLVSSGGSSILSFAVLLGLCYSVALRQTGKRAVLEIS